MSDAPIADHALLSDCHSAALIDRRGSIEWWCPARFDSPSVFARLLDEQRGGHFAITPVDPVEVTRRYLESSLVVATTFRTRTGALELVDGLAMAEGVRGHDLGTDSPHALLRRAVCTEGQVELSVDFSPRFEYGLTTPRFRTVEGGIAAQGGPATLLLSTGTSFELARGSATAEVALSAGEEVTFALQYGSSWEPLPAAWNGDEIRARLVDTCEAWRSWESQHQRYQGPYADLVSLGGKVLQGLMYKPTGAIVAAATTSLPESIGGGRNWDYRYAWVRDASFTLDALWVAACPDEAASFLNWLTTAASSFHVRGELQIMFGLEGERDLTEHQLAHLSGWRDSTPVRVGNDAWSQRQIDVYGELLGAVHRLRDVLGDLDDSMRALLVEAADAACDVWQETDQGIWEVRDEPRHYVYSKLQCWVALDRAISMAEQLGADERVETWKRSAREVRDAILTEGWNEQVGAFTQAFGTTALDASNLLIPAVGFLPADDPRVLSTVEAIERDLTDERGLVCRYRADDGLAGEEGSFLVCTFWLAEALARAGLTERARSTFERAAAFANDLGLLSEEVESRTGEMIGNFPQALSHIGLVQAAWAISEAES